MFEPELRQRLADLGSSVTTAKRVRAALLEGLPSGLVTMEDVAKKLGSSKRTLQRHMEAEGTSFQLVLQETREALARHYLEHAELPVAEISFLLSFDEPNSFYRAFRKWTGDTPERVRQQTRRKRR
jgi:AraC-like DNA-binding protein